MRQLGPMIASVFGFACVCAAVSSCTNCERTTTTVTGDMTIDADFDGVVGPNDCIPNCARANGLTYSAADGGGWTAPVSACTIGGATVPELTVTCTFRSCS